MDKRVTSFLTAARSCALSPVEHAQVRAALAAHTLKTTPSAVLRESSTALQLTDYEKAIGRANLLSFMRSNPLERRRFSFSFLRTFFRPLNAALSSALLALTLLIGGGVAYATEGSLPGDLLYPVKVHVSEPFLSGLSTLSTTPTAHAQWSVRLIERRLLEATALTERPDQNERQIILRAQMEQDADALQDCLGALPPEERKMVRRDLLSELTEHQNSLRHIRDTAGIPHALRVLAEDAADQMQEPIPEHRDEQSSSSEEEEPDRNESRRGNMKQFRELIVVPALPEKKKEKVREETSSESSGTSASFFFSEKRKEEREEKPEILPKEESRKRGDWRENREKQEDTVESLLDLLRETLPPVSSSEVPSALEERTLSSSSLAQSLESREEKEKRGKEEEDKRNEREWEESDR